MKKLITLALGLSVVLGAISMPAQAAAKKHSRIKHAKRANPINRPKKPAHK